MKNNLELDLSDIRASLPFSEYDCVISAGISENKCLPSFPNSQVKVIPFQILIGCIRID
jgi:hypothetical protein